MDAFPLEVWEIIVSHCEPNELLRVTSTCRDFRLYVNIVEVPEIGGNLFSSRHMRIWTHRLFMDRYNQYHMKHELQSRVVWRSRDINFNALDATLCWKFIHSSIKLENSHYCHLISGMLDSRVLNKSTVIIAYGPGKSKTCGDINDYLKLFNLTAYMWPYYIYSGIPDRDINVCMGEPIISYYDIYASLSPKSRYASKAIYGFHKS